VLWAADSMTKITTLIFDWGGVFQRTEDYAPREELAHELGMDESVLEQAVFQGRVMMDASLGKLLVKEAWERVVAEIGFGKGVTSFVERFFAGDRIDQRLVQLVNWEQTRGMHVGLLSNAPQSLSTDNGLAGRWGIEGLFDAQVFSYQVGLLKPDKGIFQAALQALSATPAESVFIDDMQENVLGAQSIGIAALLFTNLHKLLEDLDHIGIAVPAMTEIGIL
jgi:putative hydrolase of the HAD superfamily